MKKYWLVSCSLRIMMANIIRMFYSEFIITLLVFTISCNIKIVLFVHCERSSDEMLDLITGTTWAKLDEEHIVSVAGELSEITERRTLPEGPMFKAGLHHDHIKCGAAYQIAKYGHINFRMFDNTSWYRPCYYAFIGSAAQKCQATLLCHGILALKPQAEDGKCEDEYFVVTDGTYGMMSGCGLFSFSHRPRISRNNGTDLYVYMKAQSRHSCMVFCREDLEEKPKPLVKPFKTLAPNHNFHGPRIDPGCKCGKRRDFGRIVGGETAFPYEFPWLGSVVFKTGKKSRKPFCGGALISNFHFITAAHCFVMNEIRAYEIQILLHAHVMDRRVRKGKSPDDPEFQGIPGWDLPMETDESADSIRMDVAEIRNHPLFDKTLFDYDIAIVRFKEPVDLHSSKIAPICLPELGENLTFYNGDTMLVAGWGKPWENAPAGSRILQKLDVPYVDRDECRKYTLPTNRHLCAGYLEGGKDACTGDSGGPLAWQFNRSSNQYLLAGVVSAGAGCARKQKLGLYTDVQELLQWVYHHTIAKATWCAR